MTTKEKLTAIFARFLAEVQKLLNEENASPSEFVNVPQARELLGGVCRQSLYNYEESGRLKSYRVSGGRKKMYRRVDVLGLLQSSQEGCR